MELTPGQVTTLEKILRAGFRFVTIERAERYLGVEREGFVALLEPIDGGLRLFGQAGYLMGDGIGMLMERGEGKCFVCHERSIPVTPEGLADYERFRQELREIVASAGTM